MKIYCKFTVESACKRVIILTSVNIWRSYRKKADCLTRSVCLGTVLLKDEELARYLEYGKKQLLLTGVTTNLTWLRQLSNWGRPILSC